MNPTQAKKAMAKSLKAEIESLKRFQEIAYSNGNYDLCEYIESKLCNLADRLTMYC